MDFPHSSQSCGRELITCLLHGRQRLQQDNNPKSGHALTVPTSPSTIVIRTVVNGVLLARTLCAEQGLTHSGEQRDCLSSVQRPRLLTTTRSQTLNFKHLERRLAVECINHLALQANLKNSKRVGNESAQVQIDAIQEEERLTILQLTDGTIAGNLAHRN